MTGPDPAAEALERLKANLQLEVEAFKAQQQIELERWRDGAARNLEAWRDQALRSLETWRDERRTRYRMFDAIVEYSVVTIRSLVLVNGAAIVGIVSFTGNLWSKDAQMASATAVAIGPAMGWFIGGLAAALLTAGFSYLAQVVFGELQRPLSHKIGQPLRILAILLAIGSFAGFVRGSVKALSAFEHRPTQATPLPSTPSATPSAVPPTTSPGTPPAAPPPGR